MFQSLRRLPNLQRKFVYLLFASILLFLFYLLSNFGDNFNSKNENVKSEIIKALTSNPDEINKKPDSVNQNGPSSVDVLAPHGKTKPISSDRDEDLSEVSILENNSRRKHPLTTTTSLPLKELDNNKLPIPGNEHVSPIRQKFTGPENERQKAVVNAFMHAWNAYKKFAWGHDELKALSKSWQEWMGVGLTIVDSIDTILIMGLDEEFRLARDWVSKSLNYDRDVEIQLFEMTIRVLGGLLSAYHLSGDEIFLLKAIELGNKFDPCFKGTTPIPCNRINLKRQAPSFIEISTAETGSIQLEFRDLSRSSNDSKYEAEIMRISEHLHGLNKFDGLVPCFLNPFAGQFHVTSMVSVGASADSYYEYLLKQWIQTGKTIDWMKNDYLIAVEGIKKKLLRYSEPSKLAFVGALSSATPGASFRNEMEHLACFLPGTLALGVIHGLNSSHLTLAVELAKTCYTMYEKMPTGLGPEIATMNMNPNVNVDISVQIANRYNIQRPETVESLFYLYRATKDPIYREWGWNIFQAFEKYTRLAEGYASIDSVMNADHPMYRDKMETFYLAETLKYLYLLFSDNPNLLPLDKYVMNTEAHPLPVYTS